MAGEYYVYKYVDEQGVLYYIGKGKNKRMHIVHAHTTLPPVDRRIVIQENMSNEEAKELEISLIRQYKRKIDGGTLDNIKLNQWACHAGWKHSAETKEKISAGNLGKIRSAEAIANYSKPKTAEHAQKIREANIGNVRSEETKKKISETLKGNIPWNKGKTGGTWSAVRRTAQNKRGSE